MLGGFAELPDRFIVHVENGDAGRFGAAAFEKNSFRGEVLFHGLVIVEVGAGQVGEYADIELQAPDPFLHQGMR